DTLQVVWARYTGAFVLALLFTGPAAWRAIHVTSRPGLQLGRSTLLLASTVLNFLALRYLQLDQALAILFSTPFFVTALSGPMLGERVRWRRWTAVAVGFLGVLLVTRPGFGGIHPAAFLVVGGRGGGGRKDAAEADADGRLPAPRGRLLRCPNDECGFEVYEEGL
ncbi:MAG: DMT family transporter, partial [Firmicutes bacterium]|nr:DMT family transporter [Bacillota bacterium]